MMDWEEPLALSSRVDLGSGLEKVNGFMSASLLENCQRTALLRLLMIVLLLARE
jgi:hypothetical protein